MLFVKDFCPKKEKMEDLIKKLQKTDPPVGVSIIGTTFGNELQVKILKGIYIHNFLLFYLVSLATLRWLFQGN